MDQIRQLVTRFDEHIEHEVHVHVNGSMMVVESMLSLNKRLAEAQTDHERNILQRQIDHTDRQIDTLVYELYDLTDDEIKIVEGEQ